MHSCVQRSQSCERVFAYVRKESQFPTPNSQLLYHKNTDLSPQPTPLRRPPNASIAILAAAAAIALLYFGRVFFVTVLIAIIIAFLLDPLVTFVMKLRLPRAFASFVVCSVALAVLYLLGLGIYTEFANLVADLPIYSQRINALADSVATKVDEIEKKTWELIVPKRFQNQPPQPSAPAPQRPLSGRRPVTLPPSQPPPIQEVHIHSDPKPLYSYVYGYVRTFYNVALMASFVPFLVYFMLSWRDHIRGSFLRLFRGDSRLTVGKTMEGIAEVARAFVIGNFALGLLVGFFSSIFFFAIRLPYWPLIGPLSGFLSMVPYVGMPLAILPPLVAGLAVYDRPGIYVLIAAVIGLLHLLALNLLYPKMVGGRVHLNPLVVTLALMFWGTLWGGIGLVLAIPLTAGLKAVCDNVGSLQGYGKLLGD
jgi:predicted PurR-regulated permease PerM